MRKFRYTEPGENNEPIEIIMTEEEILWTYWYYWSEEMKKNGDASKVNIQNCIEDWIVVNWAEEIK